MAHMALVEKRPFLLASVLAALAYFLLRDDYFPGLALIGIKGAAVGLLAVYARLRHPSRDAGILMWAMALAALGDMALEVDIHWGGLVFFASHLAALSLFLQPRNRRANLTAHRAGVAALLLLGTPLLAWLLAGDANVALYGLTLGAMAGAAWTSRFSLYHVGAGVLLYLVSDLLFMARMGAGDPGPVADFLIWPAYYIGQFLICTGVIQALRRDHQA